MFREEHETTEEAPEPEAPLWAHLVISRLDRIAERVEHIEAGMARVIARVAQFDGVEGRLLDNLQPLLLRRHDDVVLLRERLNDVASDVQELRGQLLHDADRAISLP